MGQPLKKTRSLTFLNCFELHEKWRQTEGLRWFLADCQNTLGPVSQCFLDPGLLRCPVSLCRPTLRNVAVAAVADFVDTVILLNRCGKI